MMGKLCAILADKLTPILAFTILWTIVILLLFDWKYFDEKTAIFLLVPVLGVLFFLIMKEFLRYKEKIAIIHKRYQG